MTQVRRILAVEDSPVQQRLYDIVLGGHRDHSFEIEHASNGREGLSQLARHPGTSLILLDVNMPEMSGLEFLACIMGEPLLRQIPVVICSSEDKADDIRRGLKLGARAYIVKPFKSEDLLAVVYRVLQLPRVESAVAPGTTPRDEDFRR